ncbi:hypothetical protein Tco_1208195 [Tanacetum coccineum]
MTHPSPKRNMVPKAVLMRYGLVSITTARPVNTAQPKITVMAWGTCPILLTLKKLMEDMLPLEVTQKEGKSQADVQLKLVI